MELNKKINILLVDDRPDSLLALEAILSDPNQNIVRATSGEEALRCLLKDDFAVILLDIQMPEMDGFETANIIRKCNRFRHIPIIFMTAYSKNHPDIFKGYALGAVDYIFKPIIPEILRDKIRAVTDV